MAQSTITFNDKIENSGATADGRMAAADINEMKTVTNANSADAESRIASLEGDLGWANYVDSVYTSVSPLLLNAGNGYTAALTIDGLGGGSTSAQWPAGVAEPWNTTTNKLVATEDGSKYTYRLEFKAQDGAQSVLLDVFIDIGGAIGEISRRSVSVAKGASVETSVEIYSSYFTGATFVTNGGTINVATDGETMSIWDIQLLIEKTYKA